GADIQEFAAIQNPAEATELSALGQKLFDKLAKLRVPSVAIISGACLGGGLELALACDYRILINDPKTQVGFPETELGLLPAWGGTQRLPRLIGVERTFQVILANRKLNSAEAYQLGLADAVGISVEDEPPAFLEAPFKRSQTHYMRRTWRQTFLEGNPLGRWLLFRGTERVIRRRVPEDMPAPLEACQAIKTGFQKGWDAGLAY